VARKLTEQSTGLSEWAFAGEISNDAVGAVLISAIKSR
jgi:hypothetical protein